MICDHIAKKEDLLKNVKGVVFLACPLQGANVRDGIKNDLWPYIAPVQPFVDQFQSMLKDEVPQHFYESGFALSETSSPASWTERERYNERFLKLGIPFKCLVESKPTYMPFVGKSYYTVDPEYAKLIDP